MLELMRVPAPSANGSDAKLVETESLLFLKYKKNYISVSFLKSNS